MFFYDPMVAFSIPDHETVICDSPYWQSDRPYSLKDRLQANAGRALRKTDATWMLHVDTDEILISTTPITQRLAEIDDDVFSVLVRPVEAVYAAEPTVQTAFATPYFKQPITGWPKWRSRRVVEERPWPLREVDIKRPVRTRRRQAFLSRWMRKRPAFRS